MGISKLLPKVVETAKGVVSVASHPRKLATDVISKATHPRELVADALELSSRAKIKLAKVRARGGSS